MYCPLMSGSDMKRDWRKLPYWNTGVSIDKSLGEISKELEKRGITTLRTTRRESPFAVVVEWEQEVREVLAVVAFSIEVQDEELRKFTKRQKDTVRQQAVRLIFHTVKNLLAAVDAGLITIEEAFLSNIQTWDEGCPTTVGELILSRIEKSGQ